MVMCEFRVIGRVGEPDGPMYPAISYAQKDLKVAASPEEVRRVVIATATSVARGIIPLEEAVKLVTRAQRRINSF